MVERATTDAKRYLEFVNKRTGAVSERDDVTGDSERDVERCLRGMLINIGSDWFVRDTNHAAKANENPA